MNIGLRRMDGSGEGAAFNTPDRFQESSSCWKWGGGGVHDVICGQLLKSVMFCQKECASDKNFASHSICLSGPNILLLFQTQGYFTEAISIMDGRFSLSPVEKRQRGAGQKDLGMSHG